MTPAENFFDLLLDDSYHKARKSLFSHLSLIDLGRLYSHRSSNTTTTPLFSCDINDHLSTSIKQPNEFRSLMAKYGAILSGTDILRFLEGVSWRQSPACLADYMAKGYEKGSVLEVYVPEAGVPDILTFLMKKKGEGYEFQKHDWQAASEAEAWTFASEDILELCVESFRLNLEAYLGCKSPALMDRILPEKLYEMEDVNGYFLLQRADGTTIEVFATDYPLSTVLNSRDTTCLYNFCTWNRAYSIFPSLTFRRRISAKTVAVLPKAVGRNLTAYEHVHDLSRRLQREGMLEHRRVGDSFSWIVELDTSGVDISDFTTPAVPDVVYDYATFGASYSASCGRSVDPDGWRYKDVKCNLTIHCEDFMHPILKQVWTVDESWEEALEWFAHAEIKHLSYLFEEDVRKHIMAYFESDSESDEDEVEEEEEEDDDDEYEGESEEEEEDTSPFPREKPKGFEYADGEVVGWYGEWLKEKFRCDGALPRQIDRWGAYYEIEDAEDDMNDWEVKKNVFSAYS